MICSNVAEIFKTPGKLRGKTPRTARKLNPLEIRAVSRMDSIQIQGMSNTAQPLSDVFSATPRGATSPFKHAHFERPVPTFRVAEDEPAEEKPAQLPILANSETTSSPKVPYNPFDSGYYGSQDISTQATQLNEPAHEYMSKASPIHESPFISSPFGTSPPHEEKFPESVSVLHRDSEERRTTEGSFESAKEVLSRNDTVGQTIPEEVPKEVEVPGKSIQEVEQPLYPVLQSPLQNRNLPPASPQNRSPKRPSPEKEPNSKHIPKSPSKPPAKLQEPVAEPEHKPETIDEDEQMDDADIQTPSDGSSPFRPIVRKSSLNFASLPAREPITTKKSLGNRASRISQLEQPRASYYGRSTGGKSLGNIVPENQDDDEMDIDTLDSTQEDDDIKIARLHNKTSTQRLQDQISMLGQSQPNVRPSKSIAGGGQSQISQPAQQSQHSQSQEAPAHKSPQLTERPPPGAFPQDEEDSWIGPPTATISQPSIFSPRPPAVKSQSTDIMDGIYGKEPNPQFNIPKRGDEQRHVSPAREPAIPEQTISTMGHMKSVSTSVLRSPKKAGDSPGHKKAISVSNPNPSINSKEGDDSTSRKSPPRSFRGSPVKAAKDKFSSILKASRGLFASSALVSADAKVSSNFSPPNTSRLGLHHTPSFEDVLSQTKRNEPAYPNLNPQNQDDQPSRLPDGPPKASARKTRASTEREERKHEEGIRAAEAKEARKMEVQLERARKKVKEEARVFHQEQERVAAMQKQVAAKDQERQAKASHDEISRATRKSPRKTKAQLEAEGIAAAASSTDELAHKNIEMSHESHAMPPPPRPKSQIGRPAAKRPLRPAKEPLTRAKPPTVIRVDTGSQRGHQYHPSNSTLSATLQESLASSSSQQTGPSHGLRHKASTSSIQSKASTNSFRSTATRALEAAARKKEQVYNHISYRMQ